MPWILIASLSALGVSLLLYGRRRGRALRPPAEALPARPIGELEEGRFRVVGRVVPIGCERSELDGSDCVFLERAEYSSAGSGLLLRTVRTHSVRHPFLIADPSGEIRVDPEGVQIECVSLTEDGGLVEERRLRAGEEVELVATFRRSGRSLGPGPYRAQVEALEPIADPVAGPPRISYRTDAQMLWAPRDPLASLAGGIGGILLGMSAFLTFIFGATM